MAASRICRNTMSSSRPSPTSSGMGTMSASPWSPLPVVASRRQLREDVSRLRRLGKRIVFTNGCFDVLHSGHVQYLEQSRALGDVLVVGLNSDASVSRLKGSGRPVNEAADRAAILAGLRCVDCVVVFDEDTPYALIEELQPDVLTKGGDYTPADIVGHDLVEETIVLPFVPGRSTSSLIRTMINGRHDIVNANPDPLHIVPRDVDAPESFDDQALQPEAVGAARGRSTI